MFNIKFYNFEHMSTFLQTVGMCITIIIFFHCAKRDFLNLFINLLVNVRFYHALSRPPIGRSYETKFIFNLYRHQFGERLLTIHMSRLTQNVQTWDLIIALYPKLT